MKSKCLSNSENEPLQSFCVTSNHLWRQLWWCDTRSAVCENSSTRGNFSNTQTDCRYARYHLFRLLLFVRRVVPMKLRNGKCSQLICIGDYFSCPLYDYQLVTHPANKVSPFPLRRGGPKGNTKVNKSLPVATFSRVVGGGSGIGSFHGIVSRTEMTPAMRTHSPVEYIFQVG